MLSRRFASLLTALWFLHLPSGFAQVPPSKAMAVYVLEFQTDIKGDLAIVAGPAARDMSVAIEQAFSQRRLLFRVLERRNLNDVVTQSKMEKDQQAIARGEKPSGQFIRQLQGADGFVRGELLNRVDGVELTVSLTRLNSEKIWQGRRRHSLIEWLDGNVRQKEAESLAAEAAAALLPPVASDRPGEDGPRGIELASAGNCRDALPLLQNAAVIDTSNAEIYFRIGRCLNAAGDFEGASGYLTSAIARSPRRAELFAERARSLAALQLTSRALEDLNRAIGLDARNLPAIELRGDILMQNGKYDDAVKAYYEVYQQGATRDRCQKLAEAERQNGASDAAARLERSCASVR